MLLGNADRQDTVLEAVIVENVGEASRDDAADAKIQQRPWRVLTRGPASEIIARHNSPKLNCDTELSARPQKKLQFQIRLHRVLHYPHHFQV